MLKVIHNAFLVLTFVMTWLSISGYPANGQTGKQGENFKDAAHFQGCSPNSDPTYDRQTILKKLDRILKKSIPYYNEFPLMGFFVFDLTEPSNSYKLRGDGLPEQRCINFINNDVYHFSAAKLHSSKSQIAILEDGKLKVFNSINCKGSKEKLDDVLRYVGVKLKDSPGKEDTITRLKHYRRYGVYKTVDEMNYSCSKEEMPKNSDKLYSRREILDQFGLIIGNSVSADIERNHPLYRIEESRAAVFFVYDLTDTTNKQTSLLERIEFKNNHIYHFADIDLPFSFSNIAVLEDGKLKIFKSINCEGKGDSLKDVVSYLTEKLKDDKNKDEIINRVKNYREYGVYASFNGLSTPQCGKITKPEK